MQEQQGPAIEPAQQQQQQGPAVEPAQQQQGPAIEPAQQQQGPAIEPAQQGISNFTEPNLALTVSRIIAEMQQQQGQAIEPAQQGISNFTEPYLALTVSRIIAEMQQQQGPAIEPAQQQQQCPPANDPAQAGPVQAPSCPCRNTAIAQVVNWVVRNVEISGFLGRFFHWLVQHTLPGFDLPPVFKAPSGIHQGEEGCFAAADLQPNQNIGLVLGGIILPYRVGQSAGCRKMTVDGQLVNYCMYDSTEPTQWVNTATDEHPANVEFTWDHNTPGVPLICTLGNATIMEGDELLADLGAWNGSGSAVGQQGQQKIHPLIGLLGSGRGQLSTTSGRLQGSL
eukprot:gene11816-14_t